MKRLINMISDYVFKREIIPDEYLYELSVETALAIESCDTERFTDEFWLLANYVESYWRGKKYTGDDSPERIYQMGQLLSYIKLIDIWYDRLEKNTSLNEYAIIMNDKFSFFKTIHDESGITHKELAYKMRTSVSALSQFVNKIQGNGFFISRPMGREKHYYLTKKGEKIYEIIAKKQRTPVTKCFKLESLDLFSNQNKTFHNSSFYKLDQRSNIYVENTDFGFSQNIDIVKFKLFEDISEVSKWNKKEWMTQKEYSRSL